MTGRGPASAVGYADEAKALAVRYESLTFDDAQRDILHLIPAAPAKILDIGAGTGRDAAALDALGYHVIAVEPVTAMRDQAIRLHSSPRIEWVDDCLPELSVLSARQGEFGLVLMTAVWMHLDSAERILAMATVAQLVAIGGIVAMTLRHGPLPTGRRMFDVTPVETIGLAAWHSLDCILRYDGQHSLRQPGVRWDRLAFRRR